MEQLKIEIYKLYNSDIIISLENYNRLIKDCVNRYEMAAVVFLYDDMKSKNINPDKYTYTLIDKLHSKTIPESNEIYIKNQNVGKLKPRRRIHKIMKGYYYSDNYNSALKNLDKVKDYLNNNPAIKNYNKIKLAKNISKQCNINLRDARYIITNLKRTKFLVNEVKQIDDFSKISNIHKQTSSTSRVKQTKISEFFKSK